MANVSMYNWKLTFCGIHWCQSSLHLSREMFLKVALLSFIYRTAHTLQAELTQEPLLGFPGTPKCVCNTKLTSSLVSITRQGVNAHFLFFWLQRMSSFRYGMIHCENWTMSPKVTTWEMKNRKKWWICLSFCYVWD